ncbi:hypothetical protein [Cellulosimicrobium sp. Marseille-Q4280]|uniref:hypothetical protein n=1 Tax=Cellulosimicrobium sp. Marseille-Q4280 TaxID=2937992 RepID=UPI00203C5009|nr:hypothetical protein [Cellulosimicrobium sp. Marseille-Q4280]
MTTYLHSRPRARKAHVCDVCSRTIEPGETYTRGVGLDGGAGAWTYRYCAHCAVLITYLSVWFNEDEYVARELVENWEPRTGAGRAVKAAAENRWRTGDGALTPVPVILTEDTETTWRPTGIVLPEHVAA